MITTTDIKIQYSPISDTTQFAFPIRYFEASDINVEVIDSNGDLTTLTLGAVTNGFSVSPVNGLPENGATITTTETYTAGDAITIYRKIDVTQEASFKRGGNISPDVLNASLDRSIAVSQQISDDLRRAIVAPISDPDGLNYTIPTVSERAGKAQGWDASGNASVLDIATEGGAFTAVNASAGLIASAGIISGKVDGVTMTFDGNGQIAVKDGGVGSTQLASDAVSPVKIQTSAITESKIANGSVTLSKLATIAGRKLIGNANPTSATPTTVDIIDDNTFVSATDSNIATAQSTLDYMNSIGVRQIQYTQTGAKQYFPSQTVIPNDDTIPQITEGSEVMTRTITPKDAQSILKIDVTAVFANNGTHAVAALFKDADADALACSYIEQGASQPVTHHFTYLMPSGSTATKTFRVRVGGNGGITTFNGDNNDTARYGGVLASSIIITEIGGTI
jgi:hypothetical protein